jgi:hypothetical protein
MAEKQLFQCSVCGLHYENKEIAKKCEAYCKEHNGCSLDITKLSVERNKQSSKSDSNELSH